MATLINDEYTGDGSSVLFSFTFPYISIQDVKVTVDSVLQTLTTEYTFANVTTISFNTAPADGAEIVIYRETDSTDINAVFYPGSAIRAQDLNDNFTQNLYVTQESERDVDEFEAIATEALTKAEKAVSTANDAETKADNAVSTANTADSNATTALSNSVVAVGTADDAEAKADAAIEAISDIVDYDVIDDVNDIPTSPADKEAVRILDSTGIESFTPLTGLPAGFVGDPGIYVQIGWVEADSTWVYQQYAANDPDDRYGVGSLWRVTGSNIYPNNDTDNVLIGGTLPDNPEIELKADGQITTAGNVKIGGTSAAPKISLKADGDITASGNVGIGTSSPTEQLHLNGGKLKIDTTSGARAITLNAPTNGCYITLETAGTAFADIGAEKGAVGTGSVDDLAINVRGSREFLVRTNSAERLRINSSGATFVGTVDGNSGSAAGVIGGKFQSNDSSTGYPAVQARQYESGGHNFQGRSSNGTITFSVTDGGTVNVSDVNSSGGGSIIDAQGYINLRPASTLSGAGSALSVFNGGYAAGNRTVSISKEGAIVTDGTVTAANITSSNVTLNLEPDNDANYTTTTETYTEEEELTPYVPAVEEVVGPLGNVLVAGTPAVEATYHTVTKTRDISTYTGPILDVKDRLQNLISRIDSLEANEITDDATDSALLQLVAALSARLDERDAQIAALTARVTTLEL